MKLLSDLSKQQLDNLASTESKLVHYYATTKGYVPIDPPIFSDNFACPFCGGEEGIAFLDHCLGGKRGWLCKRVCIGSKLSRGGQATNIPPTPKRALLWPVFCEENGIGDVHHDVKFENINQSQAKIEYLLKFATSPKGLIFMQGDPGTGKTYCSMAVCEFFTRKSPHCFFTTQKQMCSNWLQTFKEYSKYVTHITSSPLLVIDDFGTAEMPSGFLAFFMDLINTRLQWTNRGTIITTNLSLKDFNTFCGQALSDRIMTGQIFEFQGKSRRTKTIL